MSTEEAPGHAGFDVDGYPALDAATEHQPGPAAALRAALDHGPVHAYLLQGPAGSGKRSVARAFAAEILARGAVEGPSAPEEARRRALLEPSPHPDLIWLSPDGVEYRVEEVRERLIRAATLSPFEGGRRVFVVEAAEALRQDSQNALLKTLEEPPARTHILLVTDRPDGVEPTVRSRCQEVAFRALPAEVIERALGEEHPGRDADERRSLARLSGGDLDRARWLGSETGSGLREAAEQLASSAAGAGHAGDRAPWSGLLEATESAASESEGLAESRLEAEAEVLGRRSKGESSQIVKRESRLAKAETLGLGLELVALWLRDLAVAAAGAEELAHNADRLQALRRQAAGLTPEAPRRAAEIVAEHRRRLALNVSEELLLEALYSRLERELR